MSRENAIKFLRDISMGIDYLENAYSTNRQMDPIEDNSLRVIKTTTSSTQYFDGIVSDVWSMNKCNSRETEVFAQHI